MSFSKFPFASVGEYNKQPMFSISKEEDDSERNKGNTLTCGLEKAKGLVEHIAALVTFVRSDGEDCEPDSDTEEAVAEMLAAVGLDMNPKKVKAESNGKVKKTTKKSTKK